MNKNIMIIAFLIFHNDSKGQAKGGIEQYYYASHNTSAVVPKIYYQNKKNWYGEVRYNYEEIQTASFNVGKVFTFKNYALSVTPFAGLVLGKLNGGSIGSNFYIEHEKLFFSSENQYTFSIHKSTDNFFFNWSEAGYQATGFLYAGIALQVTGLYGTKNNWEPGVVTGLTYKSWTLPFYIFSPLDCKRNFVIGINWEWKNNQEKRYESKNIKQLH